MEYWEYPDLSAFKKNKQEQLLQTTLSGNNLYF